MAGDLVPGQGQKSVARQEMRVSDAERTAVLDELREHFGAGRLDLSEFEERTNAVVLARYRGELTPLLADLPELHPTPTGPPVRHRERQRGPGRPGRPVLDSVAFRAHLYVSLVLAAFLLAIYFGVAMVAESDIPFWPIFPISVLGLGVGVHAAVRKAVAD